MKAHQPERLQSGHDTDWRQEDVLLLFVGNTRRFRAIVRRVLAKRLRTILDPDDLVQDIAVALLSRPLPEWIASAADFARYIGGVARNMALVQNRKHLDGRHHSLGHELPLASVSEDETPLSDEPDASDLAQHKETFADLHDWLPLRVRDIVMWVLLGYSVAEVALIYEIDEETVIAFVCVANNLRPHPERKIEKEEAMGFFKSARRRAAKCRSNASA